MAIKLRGVTPQEFFALNLADGTMTAAHHHTRLAYSTVHRASTGAVVSVDAARRLAAWSLTVPAALTARVTIDAGRACGLTEAA